MSRFRETPIEAHTLPTFGPLSVKREDLCAEHPMPPLAKLRGVARLLTDKHAAGALDKGVGVLDTRISKSGLGAAILCQDLSVPCRYYYPQTQAEASGPEAPWRITAQEHGARLIPLPASRFSVVRARYLREEPGFALPVGLPLYETALETAAVAATIPWDQYASLVLSVGTGTVLSGLLMGLSLAGAGDVRIYGVTASMDPHKAALTAQQHMQRAIREGFVTTAAAQAVARQVQILREGTDYYAASEQRAPWPIHPHYEGKALSWLEAHARQVPRPCLFWNIGS